MKKLFTFNLGKSLETELLKDLLDREGIAYTMRNEQLSTALGAVPFIAPELWIQREEDLPKAKELLDGWLSPQSQISNSWVCPACGEKIEKQFSSCWRCGKPKQEPVGLENGP